MGKCNIKLQTHKVLNINLVICTKVAHAKKSKNLGQKIHSMLDILAYIVNLAVWGTTSNQQLYLL